MTQFRSRDEQVRDLQEELAQALDYNSLQDADWIIPYILEAEARGAAEERGKGTESDRPNAYRWTYRIGGEWRFSEKFPTATSPTRKPKFISPLYTRPANVAALEARVKELEAALAAVREAIETADPAVLVCTLWMPRGAETVHDFISAALTREGGV